MLFLVIVGSVIGLGVIADKVSKKETYVAPVVKDVYSDIRNREDIKKQQELLVKETYQLEQKEKTIQAKKDAVTKFDAEIKAIEVELEAIRKEKLSF